VLVVLIPAYDRGWSKIGWTKAYLIAGFYWGDVGGHIEGGLMDDNESLLYSRKI
jgi:hypothetical protein